MFKGLHLDGEKGVGWGEDEFFLGLMLEQLWKLNYLTETANSKKGRGPPEPKPLPIPGREQAGTGHDRNTFATTLQSMFAQGHEQIASRDGA